MISKVSKSSFNESNSIRLLQEKLERNGRIKTYFTQNDRTPNTDGYFEILNKNGIPEKRFVVQIKSAEKLTKLSKKDEYSYSADCSFFHYVLENIDENPAFYFVVNLSMGEVFFKQLSLKYLLSLNMGKKKNISIHLNSGDALDEDSFYKKCYDIFINRRREYSRVFSSGPYFTKNSFDWYFCQSDNKWRNAEDYRVDVTAARLMNIPFLVRKRFHEIYYIGKGGSSNIYLLISDSPKRRLVLKQSKMDVHKIKENIDYSMSELPQYNPLLYEFYMLDMMRHPSIPIAIDYFEEDNSANLLMDYACGDNLHKINMLGAIDLLELLTVMERICDAMIYINSCNIIHGDIKPSNIIVGNNLEVTIIDFGLSQFLDKRKTKCLGYTPMYTAPEVLFGASERIKSIVTEVYSVGVTLLSLILPNYNSIYYFSREIEKRERTINNYHPLKGYTEQSLVSFFEEQLVSMGYGMHILNKALDLNPQNRYATFSDLKDDILLWRKEELINPSELNIFLRKRKKKYDDKFRT